jgi:hypothetical protein
MTVKDFGGLARVLSAGAEDKSVTGIIIEPLGCMPIDVSISTGFTWGGSIGASAGIFTMENFGSGEPPDQWPPPGM